MKKLILLFGLTLNVYGAEFCDLQIGDKVSYNNVEYTVTHFIEDHTRNTIRIHTFVPVVNDEGKTVFHIESAERVSCLKVKKIKE